MKAAAKTKADLMKETKELEVRLREAEEALQTTQKKNEELLASGRLARTVLDQSIEGIIICDEKGRMIQASQVAHRFFATKLLGRPFDNVCLLTLTSPLPFETKQFSTASVLGGKIFRPQEVVYKRGRQEFYFLMSARPLLHGKNILGCVVTLTDITERKRMEEALRQSEERYRSLVESSPDAIAVHTEERFSYVNPAGVRLFGANGPDEIIGQKVLDFVHPDYHGHVEGRIRAILELGAQTALSESRLIRMNGQAVDVEATGSPILYEGKPASQVIFRDITERKRAEEVLRRSKARFELLSQIASKLLTTDRPQEIVKELCQKVIAHLDCHAFFNYLADEEKQRFHLNAYAGIPEEAGREIEWLDDGVAVCGCAARDASRIVAENIPNTPDPRADLVKSFGIKAYACHALFSSGRVIGTLSFGTRSRTTFAEEELSLMRTVADQVAIAMERIRLVEVLRRSRDELEIRVQERTAELIKTNEALKAEVAERLRTEDALRKLNYELNERVKEINCLYSISYYVGKQYILLDEKLLNIVNLIPSGWQYPEITCARIFLEGKEYRSENFKETPWRQAGDILVRDERIGAVEIYYLEEKPVSEEGPFLREEKRLIHAIAIELGELVAHMQAEKALAEQSRILEGFFTSTITPLVFLDRKFNFIRVNEAYAKACQRQISDFPGRNHFEFYPSGAKKIFERVVESRASYQAIAQPFTFPDSPERGVTYWDWTLTPLLGDSGEVEFLVFSLQDVTDRKRAEEAIKGERMRFYDVPGDAPGLLGVVDAGLSCALCQPLLPGALRQVPRQSLLRVSVWPQRALRDLRNLYGSENDGAPSLGVDRAGQPQLRCLRLPLHRHGRLHPHPGDGH